MLDVVIVVMAERIMKYKSIVNTNYVVINIMKNFIKEGYKVLDCTVGNGNDTALLAELVGLTGKVYGFDIQEIAIENTQKKLEELDLFHRVVLIKDSHEYISQYIDEGLDLAIYNLGYLPKGDKGIKTNGKSTLKSIIEVLKLINKNGIILITVYTGHEGGEEEKNAVENFLSSLDQKIYNVLKFDFINQVNNPPILYTIEKSS